MLLIHFPSCNIVYWSHHMISSKWSSKVTLLKKTKQKIIRLQFIFHWLYHFNSVLQFQESRPWLFKIVLEIQAHGQDFISLVQCWPPFRKANIKHCTTAAHSASWLCSSVNSLRQLLNRNWNCKWSFLRECVEATVICILVNSISAARWRKNVPITCDRIWPSLWSYSCYSADCGTWTGTCFLLLK